MTHRVQGTTLTRASVRLTIDVAPAPAEVSRIANLSIRTQAGSASQTLIVGFVVGGAGTLGSKPLLIRGVGPTLTAFGVAGVLMDPKIELFNGASAKLTENDNWSGTATLTTAFETVGAFRLDPNSRDAALLTSLNPGTYTVQVSGVGNTTGVALVEIYDAP